MPVARFTRAYLENHCTKEEVISFLFCLYDAYDALELDYDEIFKDLTRLRENITSTEATEE